MKHTHEVEYRALIRKELFDQLIMKGRSEFKASFRGPITIQDTYFCPKEVRSFSEIEMDKVGSYNLRLRRQIQANDEKITLTAKSLTRYKDHSSGLEYETAVSLFDQCRGILETIGFKSYFEIEKNRYTYEEGGVLVCLEDIKDFKPVLEVEIITTENKIDKARIKLLALLESYRIPQTAILEKSVTNVLMRERARFN